ncbi:MAG: hypothetical protein QXR06_03375, partial [Candidatus Bathyarchaeia archaeon]
MSALKLRFTMLATLAAIIGLSTLFFTIILALIDAFNIISLGVLVFSFNFLQWLIAPYIIDAIYRVRNVSRAEEPELYNIVEGISTASGVKTPQIKIANIPIPNA